jgi:2,4-dienoyl-CoA reductase-like NADH-dependent reductase (Old Yellow Enzyme family)/NADH dehydrogenase FAD-containing subunit
MAFAARQIGGPAVPDALTFAHLLAPGRIGALAIRNRIVMAPMGSNLAEPDGYVGERLLRYYEARARGGVGLIIVGVGAVAYPAGACIPNQVALSDDVFLPGLQRLTQRLHAHGATVAIQLQHAGKVATQDIAAGRPLWGPSRLSRSSGDLFNDLTAQEIQSVTAYMAKPTAKLGFHAMRVADIHAAITQFANAADRARRAGFDGVEIHAAHGYLIASFLSPATNRRTDEYGGPLENRARFLLQVMRAVRARVGPSFPVWCRLDAKEFRVENGITVDDARRTAELAEGAGADAIHVSAYADPTSGVAFTEAPLVHQPCGYVALAEGIKRRLKIPVIAVGRIEPEDADAIIAAGGADFVAMARKLLADPDLPNKLAAGRRDEVRPCVYSYTCVGKIYLNQPTGCAVNPATGREGELALRRAPAARPKQVLIAGGGPAGMEAARLAALSGHRVTLCDRSDRLGGALRLAALAYAPHARLLQYLEGQIRSLPIDLRLRQEVTPALVEQLKPDAILVATGAADDPPPVPGVGASHVYSLRRLLSLATEPASADARAQLAVGTRVVIIGGGLVGLELAGLLSERARDVTVLHDGETLATDMAIPRRWRALYELRRRRIQLLTNARVDAITGDAVVYTRDGERQSVDADSVILSAMRENRGLADALSGLGSEVHLMGDCRSLDHIEGALADATRIALAI